MKWHIFLCWGISIFLVSGTFSQDEPPLLWIKSYGGLDPDYGRSIVQTNDGGFLAAGYKEDIDKRWDPSQLFLIRVDSTGDSLWAKMYGGANQDRGYSAQQTGDGGFIITGVSNWDVYLIRTDSLGDTLWTRAIGTEQNTEEGFCVKQTNDNGFIITGENFKSGLSGRVVYLVRTDSNGDTLWTKTFLKTGSYGQSVSQTKDGGFIITGVTPDSMYSNTFLLKTDSEGDSLWTKYYQHGSRSNNGYCVQQTSDGGYVIAGDLEKVTSNYYISIIRTDSLGDTLWTKAEYKGFAYDIDQTSDGGFILTGSWGEDVGGMFILRTDKNGEKLWHKTFPREPGSNIGYSVIQTTDGGFAAVGMGGIDSNDVGTPNFLFIRLDSEGTIIQKKNPAVQFKAAGYSLSYDIRGSRVNINFSLSVSGNVKLIVYDTQGRLVKVLVDNFQSKGSHTIRWNTKRDRRKLVAGGVYFLKLSADGHTFSKKVTIVK